MATNTNIDKGAAKPNCMPVSCESVKGEIFIYQQLTKLADNKRDVTASKEKAGADKFLPSATIVDHFHKKINGCKADIESKSEDETRIASNVPNDNSTTELSISSETSNNDNETEHQISISHQKWMKNTKKVVVVTAGKAGVGKSTLINNFLKLEGEAAFKAIHDPSSVTTKVSHRDKIINGVQVRVIDMPGLHAIDSGERTDKIEGILGDLKDLSEKGVDIVFYCISLMNRLEHVDYENLITLTKAFGSQIWKHLIFVFTYTDVVMHNGSLEQLVGRYIDELHQQLVVKRGADIEIRSIYSFPTEEVSENEEINQFNGIVGIPVSNNPDIPPAWRIVLLLQVIRKCRKENIPAFLQLECVDWYEVAKSAGIVITSGVGGAAVGTAIGAGIGAIVGGVLTAPIGGVGAVPTAAGGAALGAKIGTITGSGAIGLTALGTRIAFAVRSRHKIEERSHLKIKEMAEKKKLAVKKASQDEAEL